MELRSGVRRRFIGLGLLLIALILGAAAAVRPLEPAYRRARRAAQSDPATALKIAERALRTTIRRDQWYWALRVTRGEMLASLGQGAEAHRILDPPLPIHVQKTEGAVRRLGTLAMVAYYSEDNQALGLKLADDAVVLAAKHVPAVLGDAYMRRGILAQSESDLREALRLARLRKDEILAANTEANIGYVYHQTGRYSEAIDVAERIMPRLIELDLGRGAKTNSGNLASLYDAIGDYETAKEVLAAVQADLGRMGLVNERIVFLDRLGDAYLATHDLENAARWYREAAGLAKANGHRQYPTSLSNLARLAIARNRYDEARKLVDEAIAIERRVQNASPDNLSRALVIRARIDTKTGRAAEAERDLQQIIAKTRSPLTRWDAEARLGELFAAQKRNELAELHFANAIEVAVKARENLASEHRFSFYDGVAELFDSYVDFLVDDNQIEKALAITEESRARTLAEGLNSKAPAQKLDPRAVARQSNATILCYWLGRKRSYVWTVTPAAIAIKQLPAAAQIEAELDQYRKDLLGPFGTLDSSAARGQKLFRTLVEPAIGPGLARESKVIVIADDRLHTLNFETLVVPSPKPHWWIEDVILANAGSLQLLGRDTRAPSPKNAMLLVGDPVSADPEFPKLRNADQEMKNVGRHFTEKTVLSDAGATASAFLAATPSNFDFIHFVAHGTASRKKPLDSAVILSREKNGESYRLFARQIMDKPLTARLVTISSCHGAGKRAFAGEGLVGLAWAFLHAGADQVVAALWDVDDSATPELMDRMYAGIRAGREPAVALREAKLAMVKANTVYRKPKYWAPFVLYDGS